ncbi:MAG: primosomal protein N', partial [Microbacterium sp.]
MTARRVARVLIDSPLPQLDRLFDYAIPAELADAAVPGVRVRVPLRTAGRVVDGFLVELGEPDASDRPLSELDAVVSPIPVLTPRLYALARRCADRAAGSASDILRLAIPKRMVRAEKAWLAAGPTAIPEVDAAHRDWSVRTLDAFRGLAAALDAGARVAVDPPPSPVVLADGSAVGAWAELLAAAAVHTLAQGRSAILVVPDHRDRAQLEAALSGRVPDAALVRDDSRQSSPARYAAFLRTLEASPCIVIGNRSAVYA